MTTYTNLSDTTLSQDKPFTQSVARALRDNPKAIAENDSTAPAIAGVDPLTVLTATNSLDLVFGMTTDYDVWEFEIINIKNQTIGTRLRMQLSIDGGATWPFGADLTDNTGGGDGIVGTFRIYEPASSTTTAKIYERTILNATTGSYTYLVGGGAYVTTSPVNAIRFYFASGNMVSGKIASRPRRKS